MDVRKTEMSSIRITSSVELDELVEMIISDVRDHEVIRDFILELDRQISDYDFSLNLIIMLSRSIDEEDAKYNGK